MTMNAHQSVQEQVPYARRFRAAAGTPAPGSLQPEMRRPLASWARVTLTCRAMPEETLSDSDWRVLRLFLMQMNDGEVDGAYGQLHRELACREERQANILRLLFSTMAAADLERAEQEIRCEEAARVEERRIAAATAGDQDERPAGNRSPAAKRKR